MNWNKTKTLTVIVAVEMIIVVMMTVAVCKIADRPIIIQSSLECDEELNILAKEYLKSQIDYYVYNLNGLKEYDDTKDYVYDYSEWLREEVGIE